MKRGVPRRVGHLWPKRRFQAVDVCLTLELINLLRNKIQLPPAQDEKKERLKDFRCFPRVSYEKTVEMINAIARK